MKTLHSLLVLGLLAPAALQGQDCRHSESLEIAQNVMEASRLKDMERLMSYFADEAVFRQAFNPGGERLHRGKEAIRKAYEQIFANIEELIYVESRYTVSLDGKTVFLEAQGDMVVTATGAEYKNTHVFRVDFGDCSQIESLLQYANPLEILRAFSPPEDP
ncbi:MAG: nuclear transport factor 2 family protein [Acidobacteriota bacterium]